MTIRIRPANRADLPRLTEIYNHYVGPYAGHIRR